MKNTRNIRNFLLCIVLILMAMLDFNFSYAAAPKHIALLPFIIYADKDFEFLEDSIYDMLTTRLTKSDQVVVLNKAPVVALIQSIEKSVALNDTTARGIGNRLNADFVLFGRLTILGNNVSVDARLVDVTGQKPTMIFFDQSEQLGAVITIISQIAGEINEKMAGSPRVTFTSKAPADEATALVAKPKSTRQTDIYAHPEKILQKDGYITSDKTQFAETLINTKGATKKSQPQNRKNKSRNTTIESDFTTTLPPPTNMTPGEKESKPKTKSQMAVAPPQKIKPSAGTESIDERFVRRENWILYQDATCYTIQIMGAHNEAFLLSFINKNQLLKQNEIAYYQSVFNGKAFYQLLYGIYHTRKEAQLAVYKFPENMRKAKPWIRSISSIQKAIRER